MTTKALTKMALLVALLCVSAYIAIPIPFSPAPLVATTIILGLMAYLLTPKQAFVAISVYLLIGAVGVPVFAQGTGGIGRILGPTGGYLLGYLVAYPLLSYGKGEKRSFLRYAIMGVLIPIPIVYVGGTISLMVFLQLPLDKAIAVGVLPFILPDIFKIIVAAWLGTKIKI